MNSTVPGGMAAMLANSLLMCIPWIAFYNIKRRMGAGTGYISFIVCWLTFEYIHLNWELSWPWLTLGNVFAVSPNWVQWYEFTGVSGGSLWVLLVNVLLFLLIKKQFTQKKFGVRIAAIVIGLLFFPLLISYYVLSQRTIFKQRTPNSIVAVQPNIDPYKKFETGQEQSQLDHLIRLTESAIDTNTKLVVWPETAIPLPIDESQIRQHPFLQPVFAMLKRHPNMRLLSGIEGFRFFDEAHKSKYSRHYPDSELYYDSYNSAALFDSSTVQLYHKSKLVPGVETLPSFLNFLGNWFEQFGGTTGGYARQDERTVLIADNSNYKIAPAICYESIYGEFMTAYMRNGANLIAIITNDGWWSETPGYKQHMNYARLRAIETRKWIVRSANTGISCFIDPEGQVLDAQPWDKATAIKHHIPANGPRTFYAMNGDIISKIAIALTIVLAAWNIFLIIKSFVNRGKKPAISK